MSSLGEMKTVCTLQSQYQTKVGFHQSSLRGTCEIVGFLYRSYCGGLLTGVWVLPCQVATSGSLYLAQVMTFPELHRLSLDPLILLGLYALTMPSPGPRQLRMSGIQQVVGRGWKLRNWSCDPPNPSWVEV